MAATPSSQIVVCSVVRAELYYGVAKSVHRQANERRLSQFLHPYASLPFNDEVVPVYAELRSHLERQGKPIGANDLLIASIALHYGLIVVTHNTREFSRVPGLRVEDWEEL